MVMTKSTSARINGTERFYTPPALRRQLEQQQQQQLQKQQENRQKKSSRAKPRPSQDAKSPAIDEHRVESDDSSTYSNSNSLNSMSSTPSVSAGNLDRFLESTTPVVPAHQKVRVRRGRGSENAQPCVFYYLRDLWEFYNEWSAYGNGISLLLNGEDEVVQYYVPYLSGIQLFVDTPRHSPRSRHRVEENDGGVTYQDISSESSSTSNSHADQEVPINEEIEGITKASRPIFEYMARDSPYGREPLSEKIKELNAKFPGLKTYRSCDLLPSSWMCVAWYPIYRIPIGQTLKDLDACFLTFHLLSTPTSSHVTHLSNGHSLCNGSSSRMPQISTKLSVPVFGLASYKLKGSIWTSNGSNEQQHAESLLQSADDWVSRLNVDHPDFQFFLSRYNTSWSFSLHTIGKLVSIVIEKMLRLLHNCGLPKEDVDFINSDGVTMNQLLVESYPEAGPDDTGPKTEVLESL